MICLQINITIRVLLIPQIVKRDRKDYIISLSKEFSVVSKFTSFVAVEHREKVLFPGQQVTLVNAWRRINNFFFLRMEVT